MNDERMSVRLLKRQLRREIQQSLTQLANSDVIEECSYALLRLTNLLANRCASRLFQLPQFNQSRNLSIYLSMPSGELQTTSIIEKAFQSGYSNPKNANSRKKSVCSIYRWTDHANGRESQSRRLEDL
jgi:hypothetical protein